jgi:hypothetical protein
MLRPLADRASKVQRSALYDVDQWYEQNKNSPEDDAVSPADAPPFNSELFELSCDIRTAKTRKKPVILFLSGHVIKYGLGPFIVDLMRKGYVTHVACNGSVLVHEMELFLAGHTSEDVSRELKSGRFGHWAETGVINGIIHDHYDGQKTVGEMIGEWMYNHPNRSAWEGWSVIGEGWLGKIPVTSHILVGGDVIHQHPNCTQKLFGASYNDFLVLGGSVEDMNNGGVYVNVGSQVTGVEVFLKALSMARNLHTRGPVTNIVTAMLDNRELPGGWQEADEPDEDDPAYYYRPHKTLLKRAVADGGQSHYLGGLHTKTIPNLWKAIVHGEWQPRSSK